MTLKSSNMACSLDWERDRLSRIFQCGPHSRTMRLHLPLPTSALPSRPQRARITLMELSNQTCLRRKSGHITNKCRNLTRNLGGRPCRNIKINCVTQATITLCPSSMAKIPCTYTPTTSKSIPPPQLLATTSPTSSSPTRPPQTHHSSAPPESWAWAN